MTARSRKAASVGGAILLLAAVGLLGFSLRSRLYASAASEAEWEARQVAQNARDAIQLKAKETEARALAAASLNPVRALVTHSVDRATLIDAFSTEEWWRSFREEFPVVVLGLGKEISDVGRQQPAPDIEPVLAAAEGKGHSSRLLFADGRVYWAAVASIEPSSPSRRRSSFLVLARPFVAADLTPPQNLSVALVLASGGAALFSAGAPEQLEAAPQLLRRDPSSPLVAADVSWSAAAVEVAPNLVLWARLGTLAKSQEVGRTARSILGPLWGIAAVLAAVCLYLGFRGGGHRVPAHRALAKAESEPNVIIAEELAQAGQTPRPQLISAPSSPDEAGQFGRYQVVHPLGERGMVRVDLSVRRGAEGFSRLFVIKRLRSEFAGQPSAVAEFVGRAQLGSTLVHSNIVPIYDFGRVDEQYFTAEEHIIGRDLQGLLERFVKSEGGQLPPVLVFFICQEILKALEYAHTHRNSRGEPSPVIHGNISPRTILVSAMGEVKLLDFGVPQAKGSVQDARPQGSVFLSPEQVRGEPIDLRSDFFSLAMVMFWCLTGRLPYLAKTPEELAQRIKNGPGQEERDLVSTLAGTAAPVLKRALDPTPQKRFQTAEEFLGAIPPWEISRAAQRLHRLMSKLFDDDFRAENGKHSQWLAEADRPSKSESAVEQSAEVRRIGLR